MPDENRLSLITVGHHVWSEDISDRGEIKTFSALRDRLGGDCHVIVVGPQRTQLTKSRGGLEVTLIPESLGRIGFLRRATGIALRILRSRRRHVTLASDPLGGLVGLVVRLRTRVPLVAEIQGNLLEPGAEFGASWRRSLIAFVSKMVARRADGIRCVNSEIERQVRSLRPRGLVETIGTRVDTRTFAPSQEIPTSATESRATQITSVASLHPRKNLSIVIKAFASISGAFPEARLVLVGDGPQRPTLERLADELGVSRRVKFVGEVPRKRVVRILQESSVFVLPSLSEGQPRALLEAQAVGLPVIASRIPGITESVRHGETGLLVTHSHEDAWVAALKMVLGNEQLCRRLGGAARDLVVEQYGFDENIDRFATFIARVAGGRN